MKSNIQKSNATHAKFNPKLLPTWQRTPPLTREKRAFLLKEHKEHGELMRRAENHWKKDERKCLNKLLRLQKTLDTKQEDLYNKEREWLMNGTLKNPVLPANPAPWGWVSPGIPRYFPDTQKEDPAFPRAEKEEGLCSHM